MTDYISREAAIEKLKEERNYTGKFSFEEEHAWRVGFQQGITFALSDIASLPAADVRPVVRGKWVRSGEIMYCNNCKYIAFRPHHFCPNCGADMRGEQK